MHTDRRGERIKLNRGYYAETVLDSDKRSRRRTESFHGYHRLILLLFSASANGVKSYVFTGDRKIRFLLSAIILERAIDAKEDDIGAQSTSSPKPRSRCAKARSGNGKIVAG
jgi:hypothetical protein